MKQTGVGKIRENIKNLKKTVPPLGTPPYLSPGDGGVRRFWGESHSFQHGGYYIITEPLRWGKENQANFIGHNKNRATPLPFPRR